jgi:hypothetical protein
MPALTSLSGRVLNVFGTGNAPNIQDVFSTTLYTGNGGTQTITNSVDTLGKGGLVWIKSRSAATGHRLTDTARGVTKSLDCSSTASEVTESTGLTNFSSSGFTIGADTDYNTNAATYVSWAFRKQARFFDMVTYTGNATAGRTVAHNLGSVPGMIIVKRNVGSTTNWQVYHRSLGATQYAVLDTVAAASTSITRWNNTAPTATEFTLGDNATVNGSGDYIAYLFAHDASGFGKSGADNVISCGTYLGSNHQSQEVVQLGFEPQWVMLKNITTGVTEWVIVDNKRSMTASGGNGWLQANRSDAETIVTTNRVVATPTGFYFDAINEDINEAGSTFIYIAIRRPPL